MFNRICRTVSQTDERPALLGRGHHRSLTSVQPTVAPCGHLAPHWFATAEVL